MRHRAPASLYSCYIKEASIEQPAHRTYRAYVRTYELLQPTYTFYLFGKMTQRGDSRSKWSFVCVVASPRPSISPKALLHSLCWSWSSPTRRLPVAVASPYPDASGWLRLLAAVGRRGPIGWTAGGFDSMCYVWFVVA